MVSPQAMNMVLRALEQRGLVARPATVEQGAREAEQKLMTALSAEQQRDLKGLLAVLV